MTLDLRARLGRGLVASAILLSPAPAFGQDARALFHEAYYLEHEQGELEQALALYQKVAAARGADADLKAKAAEHAAEIGEELAVAELERLVPADAILYAEFDRPGEQVSQLLDQLGLLGEAHQLGEKRFAVSPLLVEHLLGLRGAAVAITSLRPDGDPTGVVLLHPGSHDGLRGLIDTLLPAAGELVEPIGEFPVWCIDQEVYVCLTRRLVIASNDREQVIAAVGRLGAKSGPSLSNDLRYAAATGQRESLLSFYVNADPLKPMMRAALQQQAQGDPGAAMALGMLDIDSLESLAGRVGVDGDGVSFELALELAEGHRNVVFNLLRRPPLAPETLELVPEGAAFFLATAMNPKSAVAPIDRDSVDQPVVSALDLGRELFGNVVDVALFGMPDRSTGMAGPLPEVTLVVRVNDAERSRALWDLGLGLLCQATGAEEPESEHLAGGELTRFSIGGVPLYVSSSGERLVLASSKASIERALGGGYGRSVKHDPVLGKSLAVLERSPTFLLAACPGRVARMAAPCMPAQEAAEMQPIAAMLGETSVTVSAEHSDTRLAFSARVENIPDLSGLIGQALADHGAMMVHHSPDRLERVSGAAARKEVAAVQRHAAGRPGGGDLESLRARLDELIERGDRAAAVGLAQRIVASVDDADGLNALAWELLTEERYSKAYDAVARTFAVHANEQSGYSNWAHLDTLALAEFRSGNLDEAVSRQEQAIEHAGDEGAEHPELEEALELYRSSRGTAVAGKN